MSDGSDLKLQPFDAEEILLFEDEKDGKNNKTTCGWKVLVADDDKSVHDISKLILKGFVFEGKSLDILNAYSGAQTKELLKSNPDISLILLDVVMEEDDMGLKIVKYIREEEKNNLVRIILRTGQPGQAPEKKVIIDFDINDYMLKTDLTADKLIISLVTALRSYRDLMILDANKRGLEKIINSSSMIFKPQSFKRFISGLLVQLSSILHLDHNSQYCKASGFGAAKNRGSFIIEAAIGDFTKYVDMKADDVLPSNILKVVNESIEKKDNVFTKEGFASYFENSLGAESIIYMEHERELHEWDKDLVKTFCSNIYIAFDNIYLAKEIDAKQKEIIFTLGEIAEFRSNETGFHVKRVAEYSKVLALNYGLSEDEAENIGIASAMHDIGKLAIPDVILNKPGKLTTDEFDIIKTHSSIGYDMLKRSNGRVMKAGSVIALQHHEKFNGKGYPNALMGENIHLYARIVAIADVFDALGSKRVYKDAWEIKKIIELFEQERGQHFDPDLIDIFLKGIDQIILIKESFKDVI